MEKGKKLKFTKTKVIRYLGIALIVGGILILVYPFYTNFVMRRQESQILEAWAEQVGSGTQETTESGQVIDADVPSADTSGKTGEASQVTSGPEDESVSQPAVTLSPELFILDPEKKVPFKIIIPKIGVEWIVHEGTDIPSLKHGPGHYPGTALPGEPSLCVIAGHRTTYGAPFNKVDKLVQGDEIILQSAKNENFVYLVTTQVEVKPDDVSLLQPTSYGSLALTTCTPKFYATRRLIIFANYNG